MKLVHLALPALLSLGGTASAQDVQFGVQGGFNLPVGDLGSRTDSRLGFMVGAHVGLYYGNGHELRPWADLTYYPGGLYRVGNTYNRYTFTAIGAGADYVYYFETRPQGLYFTAGVGLQNWHVNSDIEPSESNTTLSIAGGAGYRFNRSVAAEGRLLIGQSPFGQAVALQASASIRF